jgi:hypothetical protein
MTTIANLMGTGTPGPQAQAIVGKPSLGLSAAGANQAAATAIVNDISVYSTVGAGTGVRLPAANASSGVAAAGDIYVVVNSQGTNALLVYPPVGGNISNAGVNTAVSIPANKTGDFYCLGANLWAASIGT